MTETNPVLPKCCPPEVRNVAAMLPERILESTNPIIVNTFTAIQLRDELSCSGATNLSRVRKRQLVDRVVELRKNKYQKNTVTERVTVDMTKEQCEQADGDAAPSVVPGPCDLPIQGPTFRVIGDPRGSILWESCMLRPNAIYRY